MVGDIAINEGQKRGNKVSQTIIAKGAKKKGFPPMHQFKK